MVNRVRIREHIPNDLDAYIDWQTDPEVARYLSWLPGSRAGAEASLRDSIEQQSVVDRKRFFFAVILHDTQEVIGDVGFTVSDRLHGDCGWFLGINFQGRGYATEAVSEMIAHAFQFQELEVLTASCRRGNTASTRIMSKCGFVQDDETEKRLWYRQSRERWGQANAGGTA